MGTAEDLGLSTIRPSENLGRRLGVLGRQHFDAVRFLPRRAVGAGGRFWRSLKDQNLHVCAIWASSMSILIAAYCLNAHITPGQVLGLYADAKPVVVTVSAVEIAPPMALEAAPEAVQFVPLPRPKPAKKATVALPTQLRKSAALSFPLKRIP